MYPPKNTAFMCSLEKRNRVEFASSLNFPINSLMDLAFAFPTQHSFVRRTSDGRFFWIFGCPMDIRSVSEWDVGRPTDVQDVIQIPPE